MLKAAETYVETTLTLSEDFTDVISNPQLLMYTIITVFYLQLQSQIFQIHKDQTSAISETFVKYLIDYLRITIPSRIIIELDDEAVNILAAIGINILMMFIMSLTIFEAYRGKVNSANKYIVYYFSVFVWVLYAPFTDFFSAIIIGDSTGVMKQTLSVLGIVGLIQTYIQGIYVSFVFRNHQFRDANVSKKKANLLNYIYNTAHFVIILMTNLEVDLVVLDICYHLMILLIYVEFFECFPLPNPYISKFYFIFLNVIESNSIVYTVWFNNGAQDEVQYAFLTVEVVIFMGMLSSKLFDRYFQDHIIGHNDHQHSRYLNYSRQQLIQEQGQIVIYLGQVFHKNIDVYCEYISLLVQQSVKKQISKLLLLFVIGNHRKNCINISCYCQSSQFELFERGSSNKAGQMDHAEVDLLHDSARAAVKQVVQKDFNRIENKLDSLLEEEVSVSVFHMNRFISSIFRQYLMLHRQKSSSEEHEKITLKQVSFLTREQDNPPQAYYDLKVLAQQNKNQSFHFRCLQSVLSKSIQHQAIRKQFVYLATKQGNENVKHYSKQSAQQSSSIPLEAILEMLNFQEHIQTEIKTILLTKTEFWTSFVQNHLSQFEASQKKLVQQIQKIKQIMNHYQQLLGQTIYSSIISVRVLQLYHMMVTRDIHEIKHLEHLFVELIRKDKSMPEEYLTSLKIIDNEVEIMIASILKDKGKILNKKTPRLAAFFNYEYESFKQIDNVRQLMPPFISQIHDHLMENYLRRGYSNIIKASDRDVFIKDQQGFIKPVKLNLENFFGFKDDFNLIASLMHLNQNRQYILFDISGKIQGLSKQLFQSLKEKYDYLHRRHASSFNLKQTKQLTKEQISNASIYLFIPDVLVKIRAFIDKIIGEMKAKGFQEFEEVDIINYLIKQNLKNVELCRFHKTELYVPNNLGEITAHLDAMTGKDNQRNMFEQNTFYNSSLGTYHANMIKSFKDSQVGTNVRKVTSNISLFEVTTLDYLENYMNQHKIIYMFHGSSFKYFTKINMNFCLLAQDRYIYRNMAYFVLNISEKKVTKKMLTNIIQSRQVDKQYSFQMMSTKMKSQKQWVHSMLGNTKDIIQREDSNKNTETAQQLLEVEDPQKVQKDHQALSPLAMSARKSFAQFTTAEGVTVSPWKSLVEKLRSAKQAKQLEEVEPRAHVKKKHHSQDSDNESNSDNQFDEDITENSTYIQNEKKDIFLARGEQEIMKLDEQQSQASSRQDQVQVGSQLVKRIFSTEKLTRGEYQFLIYNILSISVFFLFFFIQLITRFPSGNYLIQQLEYSQYLSDLQENFQCSMSGIERRLIHSLGMEHLSPNWLNVSKFQLDYCVSHFKNTLIQNRGGTIQLQLGSSVSNVTVVQLTNTYQTYPSNMFIIAFIDAISTHLEDLQLQQEEAFASIYYIQNNFWTFNALITDAQKKSFDDVLSQRDSQSNIATVLYACLVVLLILIAFQSFFANKQYNRYLKFLLQAITRIKYEECNVEIKRLVMFQKLLADQHNPWIGQDIYGFYFETTYVKEDTMKEMEMGGKNKKNKDLNQIYASKFKYRYLMITYFITINVILTAYVIAGLIIGSNFINDQSVYLQLANSYQNLQSSFATYISINTLLKSQTVYKGVEPTRISPELYNYLAGQVYSSKQDSSYWLQVVIDSQTSFSSQVFDNSLKQNICKEIISDPVLAHIIAEQCKSGLRKGHLNRGLYEVLQGVLSLNYENENSLDLKTDVINFFIWEFFYSTNLYMTNARVNIKTQINDSLNNSEQKVILYEGMGIFIVGIIIIIAYFSFDYLRIQRRGAQLLLSLIPHEKLQLEQTVHLLKQLQKL